MKPVILRPRFTVRTARLSIRPLRAQDYEPWRAANLEHPPVDNPHDRGPHPASELTRAFFRSIVRRNDRLSRDDVFHSFALFDHAEKTMVGSVSLQIVARIMVQSAWIGWRVFGQHRRKGYAAEGASAALDIAFHELALHRVEAGIEPANRISARLARSLGMRKESSLKKNLFVRGGWVDLDVYAIHSEDRGVTMDPSFALSLADRRRIEPR